MIYFGVATLVGGVLLYYAVLHMFRYLLPLSLLTTPTSLVSPPGTEGHVSPTDGRTRSSAQDCAICLGQVTA